MSLAISVGYLAELLDSDEEGAEWMREEMSLVNRLLKANRLPAHREPEHLPFLQSRAGVDSFPYSWLHSLRRALAYHRRDAGQFRPMGKSEDPTKDPVLKSAYASDTSSHVINHSDCEGYYVPIDFAEPLYGELAGGILGSSYRALGELVDLAPILGIQLDGDALSDDGAEGIAQEEDGAHPLWIERQVWLAFYEAARLSVLNGTAVVFG